jgi:hypothetical protein
LSCQRSIKDSFLAVWSNTNRDLALLFLSPLLQPALLFKHQILSTLSYPPFTPCLYSLCLYSLCLYSLCLYSLCLYSLCLYSLCLSCNTPSLQILRDMQRCSPVKSSSNNSNYTGSDTDNDVELDTDLIDVNKFADNNNENDEDEAWLSLDKDHPPEHYLQQLEMFDEQEYTRQDYKESSTRLIDHMEDQWNQYVS